MDLDVAPDRLAVASLSPVELDTALGSNRFALSFYGNGYARAAIS